MMLGSGEKNGLEEGLESLVASQHKIAHRASASLEAVLEIVAAEPEVESSQFQMHLSNAT